jgi:ankyrin repeat protein
MANNSNNEFANFYNSEMFPLRRAVDSNNLEETRRLLVQGANPNQKTRAGTSALGVAVLHHNTPIVKLLLQYGAHPDEGVPDSLPLTLALNNEDLDIIEALLAANANVYLTDTYLDISPMEYLDETTFVHDDEIRALFERHLMRRRRLMSHGRNLRSLNTALGKNHGNHFTPISGPALTADPVGLIGEFLSGSKRPSLRLKTENLKVRASPPASSPSASPRSRKLRKSRKHRRTQCKH